MYITVRFADIRCTIMVRLFECHIVKIDNLNYN